MSDIRTNSETQYLGFPHERNQKVDCTPEPSPVPLERTESAPIVPLPQSPVPLERTESAPIVPLPQSPVPLERTESAPIVPLPQSPVSLERTESAPIVPTPQSPVSLESNAPILPVEQSPVQVSSTSSSAIVPDAPVKKTKGIRKSKKSCKDLIKAGEKVKKVTFAVPESREEAMSQQCIVSSGSSSDVEELSDSGDNHDAKPDSEAADNDFLDYGMRQYGSDDCPLLGGDADEASLPF